MKSRHLLGLTDNAFVPFPLNFYATKGFIRANQRAHSARGGFNCTLNFTVFKMTNSRAVCYLRFMQSAARTIRVGSLASSGEFNRILLVEDDADSGAMP